MIVLIYLLCFYFSIPGFLNKAGYSLIEGLIPFYNLYLLLNLLEIHPITLIIISLCLIFLPQRMFIVTLIYVFLPFIICDAYDKGLFTAILALICPFIMFPVISYSPGVYAYNMEED